MIANRRMVLVAIAVVCLSGSSVFAGGNGGSKRDSTIEVKNNSQTQVGVLINPSAQQIQAAQNAQSIADFRAAGGTVINTSADRSFKAKVGAQRVILVDLNAESIEELVIYDNSSLNVQKGKKTTLTVNNDLQVTASNPQ